MCRMSVKRLFSVVISRYCIINRAAVIKLNFKYYCIVTFISFRPQTYIDIYSL